MSKQLPNLKLSPFNIAKNIKIILVLPMVAAWAHLALCKASKIGKNDHYLRFRRTSKMNIELDPEK